MQLMLKDGTIMVSGIIPKDAEFKTVNSKNGDKTYSLTKFGVKVREIPPAQEGGRPQAVWANVCCWHNVARAAANLKKSDTVLIIGKLETFQYTAKDGTQKQGKQINAEFVISMPNVARPAPATTESTAAQTVGDVSEYEELLTDDGLPF